MTGLRPQPNKSCKLDRPTLGRLEQGLIFSCAMAEDYPASEVWGITITARCDIAHDKAPVLNYLPIVSLRDWMQADGRLILCSRLLKHINSQQKSILQQCGFSPSILMVQSQHRIAETLFAQSDDKKIQRHHKRFSELADAYTRTQAAQAGKLVRPEVYQLFREFPNLTKGISAELSTNSLNGFYFLSTLAPEGPADGYVVLLREVRHIPRNLAHLIASGLSSEQYLELCKSEPSSAARLSFIHSDFAMPIGQLLSPEMEHLIQVFAFLFSRIGIDDLDQDYVSLLWERCLDGK